MRNVTRAILALLTAAALLGLTACSDAPAATPTAAARQAVQASPTPAKLLPTLAAEPLQTTATAAKSMPEARSTEVEQPASVGFKGPLSVIILSIADNTTVQTDKIDLNGLAKPQTVINFDDQIIYVGPERTFIVSIQLTEGPNAIEITASDPDGNQETVYLTVTYDPQP